MTLPKEEVIAQNCISEMLDGETIAMAYFKQS